MLNFRKSWCKVEDICTDSIFERRTGDETGEKGRIWKSISKSVSVYAPGFDGILVYRACIWRDVSGKGVQFSMGHFYERCGLIQSLFSRRKK